MPRVFRLLSFLVILLTTHLLNAQTCTTISLQDTAYACPNTMVHLSATLSVPTGYNVLDTLWTPAAGISDTNSLTPTIAVGNIPGLYYLDVKTLTPQNLVFNGNFSLGDTGFSSDYTYATGPSSLVPEGLYTVTNNPNSVHPGFVSMGDHTTGTGQMMVINGASSPVSVWCQTISVEPNTYYDFSAWGASVSPNNPAVLQFAINDTLIGSVLSLPGTTDLWVEFHVVWYSGADTSIHICITDQQTAADGNDFAIDDISFRKICNTTDSIYIALTNLKDSISVTEPSCQNGKVILTAHDLPSYDTANQFEWLLGDGSTATGSPVNHQYATKGNYDVRLIAKNTLGCIDTISSTIVVNNFITSVNVSKDTTICPGDSATLWVQNSLSYSWSPSIGLSNDSIQQPKVAPDTTTTYYVTVQLDSTCKGKDSIRVSLYTPPLLKISYNDSLVSCFNPKVQLHVTGAANYLWSPANLCDDSTSADPNVSPTLNTIFTVIGTDSHTCESIDSIMVDVEDVANVFCPSAFTPNGDGKNDIIYPIPFCGFQLERFEVYNRWGQLIFISHNEKTGWDGTQSGVPCEIGTYCYQIVGKSQQGRTIKKKGDIALIR